MFSLRPAPELGVGEHHDVVPLAEFLQRALQRHQPVGDVLQQARLRSRLVGVRVESRERHAHDGDARRIGDDLARRVDGAAEIAGGEFRLEDVPRVEVHRRLHDVGFDLEHVRERGVAGDRRRLREFGAAQELFGVGQRDRARAAAGERTQVAGADDDAVRGERTRRRLRGERAREPAVLQVFGALRRGVPDLDGAKVREVGLRIADALQNRQLPVPPEGGERRQRRMQSGAIRQLHDVVALDGELRAQRVIGGVACTARAY